MLKPVRPVAALIGAGLMAVTPALIPQPAQAEVLLRAHGRCKLVSGGFDAYNGHCMFKHKRAGNTDAYVVKLDDGSDYIFRGPTPQALQVQTYRGIVNVRHRSQNDHDVFAWNDGEKRRLSVRLDHVQNPDVGFDDEPEKATTGQLLGAAVGALIGNLISGDRSAPKETAEVGTPVSDLQNLVGANAAGGEQQLAIKGYTYRGGKKGMSSSFTFYDQPGTDNCVGVQTVDGRYAQIRYTTPENCN